ncbi:MAG: DUF4382 domain-containing protein [Nitrospirae bacterium]|nr:DUF4382 domain-containing protein [Candidatus Manganitrophaceae bacterium]
MVNSVLKGQKGFLLTLLLLCEMLFLAACGSGSGNGSVSPSSQATGPDLNKGTLAVSLTDASGCDFDGVFVTIQKLRVHENPSAAAHDGGWIEIPLPNGPQQINLLTLQNGVMTDLGLAPLPAGHYTQVRLLLVPNDSDTPPFKNYVTVDGQASPLNIPAGFTDGIRLGHEFEIKTGEKEELIVDFDACRSILKAKDGSYFLRPNVLIVKRSAAGRIVGAVDATSSGAIVKAEINGYVYKQTRIKPDGTFILYPLPNSDMVKTLYPQDTAGTYDVVIASEVTATVLTTGVPVAAKGETALSTTTQPIALPLSAVAVLNGHINPTSADARVRQTINGKPYQVNRHAVDLTDGSFIFSLSADAPWYGTYATTVPVSYQKELSAAAQYLVDTPNDDGLYKVSSRTVTLSKDAPTAVEFTGSASLQPASGTAGKVTGNITVADLPTGFTSGTVLVSATIGHENVNSVGVDVDKTGAVSFTLDDLAPGTYTIAILSAKGFPHLSPKGIEIVVPSTGGTFMNADFSLSHH